MAIVEITINERIATAPAEVSLICNNPTDTIRFTFDDEWADHDAKTARFAWEGKYIDVPFSGNEVQVPEIYRTNYVYVGVFTDNLTSVAAKIPCKFSVKCLGGKNEPPKPDVYEEIIGLINGGAARISAIENYEQRPFESAGDIVQIDNFEGMPMDCVTRIEPIQQGSGDPSPDNIRPISGWTSAKLTRCGKNLLPRPYKDGDSKTDNGVTYTVNLDGSVNAQGVPTAYSGFTLYDGRVFPDDVIVTFGDDVTGLVVDVRGYSSDGKMVFNKRNTPPILIDYTNNPNVVRTSIVAVRISNGTEVSGVMRPMIRLASESDATYEPYKGETFAADFGGTVYGGTLDWANGRLTVDRAVKTFDGTETWGLAGSGYPYNIAIPSDAMTGNYVEFTTSHYKVVYSAAEIDSVNGVGHISQANNNKWYVNHDSQAMGAAGFKSYLAEQYAAGTPLQICYKLAEPITIQLTPQNILALQGLNTIWSDAGETTVSGRKDVLWVTSSLMQRIAELEAVVASLASAAAE